MSTRPWRDIAGLLRDIVHPAELAFDTSKPDGMRRKVLDVSRVHRLGWHHNIDLAEGLASTYGWFVEAERGGTARGVVPAEAAAVS